jgi:hypothetical protein
LIEKVVPIPIGLDLHTLTEKRNRRASTATVSRGVCDFRLQVQTFQQQLVPFTQRPLTIHAEFDCNFDNAMRIKTRGEPCRLVKEHNNSTLISHHGAGQASSQAWDTKLNFWRRVSASAFSLAPPGYGMDTHRAWEILNMGAVPIVISSPMNRLHSQFPIIIVQTWAEAFEQGALQRYREDITRRFGADPFNATTMYTLTSKYWVGRVQEAVGEARRQSRRVLATNNRMRGSDAVGVHIR